MPTSPYRAPAVGSPRTEDDEDEPIEAGQDVQGEQQMDAVPVRPVAPIKLTRAYSRPQPTQEESPVRYGTTGGIIPQQAGTWDKKPVARPRLSDDPVVREQQSLDRAQADFETQQRERNPFLFSGAVKKLSEVGGRRYADRAIAEGERAYEDQLRQDNAAIVDQRRAEAEQKREQNEIRLQQMIATGQVHRKDTFGNVQPVMDAQGRPLFKPTKWKKSVHPKTGKPVFEMRDQFQQRQYKTPQLMDSPDPLDDNLYADFKEEGQEPYMTKAEAAASPDLRLRKMGLAALKRQRTAQATERLSGYRQAADAAQLEIEEGRATEAALRQRAEAVLATNPEEYAKLLGEADAIKERVKDGGELSLQRMVADIDLRLETAALKRDASLIQRDELAGNLIERGIDPKTSILYIQNEARIQEAEKDLESARRQRQTITGLLQPVATPVAPVAEAAQEATLGQKVGAAASSVARGAGIGLVEGGEFLARNMVRGTPTSGVLTPGGGFIPFSADVQQRAEAGKVEQLKTVGTLASEMRSVAQQWGPRVSPEINRKLREGWMTGKIPEGIGSALSFMAPGSAVGKVGKLIGLGERGLAALASATVASSGAAVGANAFRREAETELRKKLDAGQISQKEFESGVGAAEIFGGLIGTTEAVPISRFVQRIGGTATGRNFVSEMFRRASKDGNSGVAKWLETTGGAMLSEAIEEAGQEAFQSISQDIYAAQTFDPTREVGGDTKEAAATGGAVGALMSLATQLISRRGGGAGPAAAVPPPPPAVPPPAAPSAPVETPPPAVVAEGPAPVDADLEAALLDTGITPAESVAGEPLQESESGAGSAPNLESGLEATAPASPVADESAVAEFNRKLAEIPGGPEAPVAPPDAQPIQEPIPAEPTVPTAEVPASESEAAQTDVSPVVEERAAGRPPVVEQSPEAIAQDRREYDMLQKRMSQLLKSRGAEGVNSDEYQAAWQASEDIKNRHGGMPPGEVSAEGQRAVVEPSAPIDADLRKMVDDYDAGGQVTVPDFADAIEGMSEDAPKWLSNAAERYRSEAKQDLEEFGGRGDAGDYTDALERAARRYLKQSTPKAAPTKKQPKAAPVKVDVSPILNAKTEMEMLKTGGRMMRETDSREGMAAVQRAMQQWTAPAAPPSPEQRLNDAGADLPPISSLKADQKLAELKAGGITSYNGKPIEDANPAQLSNALGKFRRGELTPEGEPAKERTSDRVIRALEAAKIRKPGQLYAAAEPFSIAYDAALDLAIVSIRAGRAVADAIKLAVARFKARYPGATDDDVARLTKAIETAAKEPPPTDTGPGAGGPPSGQTFTGPVSPGGPEFRKRSKSALGEYDYVATTNSGQQKYAQEFADWHEKNGTPDSAIAEMRAINEPAMRAAVGAELLGRTMEQWEKASVADKPILMARAASIMGDVKSEKTEAGQALQAQAMVNKRLAPYAPLLSWMDLLRSRYSAEIAPVVGKDTVGKVKKGIKDAGDEASSAMSGELVEESESAAKAARKLLKKSTVKSVDEAVAERIMRMLGPLAGYRDFYAKRGTDAIAKRISDLAKEPTKEGNIWTFDSIINSELGKMLSDGLDAAGLKTPKGAKMPDAERIAQFLSDDQLRADKVKIIDQKVREKIAALPESMGQQVSEAWDSIVGMMAESPSSATTARRMVQESLRAAKPDWNEAFKNNSIATLRDKTLTEITSAVAAVQPGGDKLNLAPLRDVLGQSFDEIAAVKKERYDKSEALKAEREAKKKQRQETAMSDWLSKHASTLILLRKAAKARGLEWGDIFNDLPENQGARQQELFDRVKAEPRLSDLTDDQRKRLAKNLDESWTYLRNGILRQEFGRLVQLPNIRKADADKIRSVVGDLIKFSNLGLLDSDAFLSAVAAKYGLEQLDGPTAQKLTEIALRLQRAKNDAERARTTLEMYDTVAKAKGVSVPDVIMSGFYSNLLNSLVTTTYAMMGGNVIQSIWNLGTLAASARRDTSKGGLFAPPSLKQAMAGASAVARGYKTGIPEGLRQALSILVTGHGGEDAAAKLVEAKGEPLEMVAEGGVWPEFEAKRPKAAKAIQTAANVAKMVPRLARAIDAVFYYPAKQASLRFLTEQSMQASYPDSAIRARKASELLGVSPADFASAEKKAKDEGFSGLDMSLRIADILEPKAALTKIKGMAETQRYLTEQQRASQEEAIGQPGMEEGTRLAAKTTLSQEPEGWAGVFYDGFSRTVENVRPGGLPVLKLLFPFLRLPTNFYNANLASTPFGAAAMAIGETPTTQKKDGKRVRRQLTETERGQMYMQSLIGSASMLYFVLMAMMADPEDPEAFDITANGPTDRAQRRQMEQAGWKPKSIRIPGTDTWVDYMNTPMAIPLTIAGHVADAYRYQKPHDELVMGNALLDASVRFPSVMFGLPALSGMQDLGELLDEENVDARKVSQFLTRTGKNFVRPRIVDEVDRMFDPTVRDDGVIRYDELGDPVERSPLSRIAKTQTDDPLRRTLLDRKLKIPVAGKETKLRGVTMTPGQLSEMAKLPVGRRAAYKDRAENPQMTPEQFSEYMRLSGARIKAKLTPLVPALKKLPFAKAQDVIDDITASSRKEAREIIRRSALTGVTKK